MSDDRVGWRAVDPEFRRSIARAHERAKELQGRLRELNGSEGCPERVRVWQELRDLDVFPHELTFYVIAWELRLIASDRYQERFQREIEPRLHALYTEHGIDYSDFDAVEAWDPDPAPAELDRVNEEIAALEESENAAVYLEFGEHVMAELYLNNHDEFQRRWKAGQDLVHGPHFFETLMQRFLEDQGDEAG